MDTVQDLDEAKAEIEKLKSEKIKKEELCETLKKYKKKLKSENRKKEELCESLKKSQNEQLIKIQEAVSKIAQHAKELIQKEDIPTKHVSKDVNPETANDDLGVDGDEADEEIECRERKFNLFQDEILGLKGLLSITEESYSDENNKTKVSKELSDGGRTLQKLEENNRKSNEQLKSKENNSDENKKMKVSKELSNGGRTLQELEENHRKSKEQLQSKKEEIKPLEQTNEKLGEQFKTSDEERGRENSALLNVIATMQERVYLRKEIDSASTSGTKGMEGQENQEDSETSVTKLRSKLKAVANKYRNISKTLKAKEAEWSSQREKLTADLNECVFELETKDKAIAELMTELEVSCSLMMELQQKIKDSAGRSTQLKDSSNRRYELDDKDTIIEELMSELEGFQSVMVDLKLQNENCSSQLQIMKKKLHDRDKAIEELEVELESCHSLMKQLKLRVEDSEMTPKLEKIRKSFNECRSETESKDRTIEELMRELEDSRTQVMQLKLRNEESEWSSQWEKMMREFSDYKPEIEDKDRTKEELLKELEDCHHQIMDLMLQNEGTSLMLMVLKAGISEAQWKLISKEKETDKGMDKKVERYKIMLAESSCALQGVISELEDKIWEGHELEFELQIWKSFADRLRANLEENLELRKELEASLLEEVLFEETFKQSSEK